MSTFVFIDKKIHTNMMQQGSWLPFGEKHLLCYSTRTKEISGGPKKCNFLELGCRKQGCNKWDFSGKSAFLDLFLPLLPLSRSLEQHLGKPDVARQKAFSSDILRSA